MQSKWTPVLLLGILCAAAGCRETRRMTESVAETAEINIRQPQVIFDEEMAIDAGGWQSRGFSLSAARPVQLSVQGVQHTDKGFRVYLMPADEVANYRARDEFRHMPGFQGLKVRRFSHTETLPAGRWAVLIANTENIFNGMIVSAKVTVDPK